jgi:dolichyl-phosphate beta-glucosyltransferase
MTPYRFSLVIPVYNERERLPGTLAALAVAQTPGFELVKVHIADNGSTDGSAALAVAVGARLGLSLVIHHLHVVGKARALATVMPLATAGVDGVLFMDADNATDLGQLVNFDPADRQAIQIGSRRVQGSSITHLEASNLSMIARRVLSLGMRVLTRWLLRLPQHDTQCGFKLFPVATVTPLFGALGSSSWVFDAELLLRARLNGLAVRECPVHWVEMPGSKVRPLRDGLGSLLGLASIWWQLRRERRPSSGRTV